MLTDKQLLFVLGEIQSIQRKNLGGKLGITITTGCDTSEFVVIVEYGFKKLDDKGNCMALDKTFEFNKTLTEDQCVDYLQDIEKLSKNNE
jgi:hypothetical protein